MVCLISYNIKINIYPEYNDVFYTLLEIDVDVPNKFIEKMKNDGYVIISKKEFEQGFKVFYSFDALYVEPVNVSDFPLMFDRVSGVDYYRNR